MLKIVYNTCYGGFRLSEEGLNLYNKKCQAHNLPMMDFGRYGPDGGDFERHDPLLVEVVEELGSKANGKHSELKIVKIPEIFRECYKIRDYDGQEWIGCSPAELIQHRFNRTKVDSLSDVECRTMLSEIIKILNTRYYVEYENDKQ